MKKTLLYATTIFFILGASFAHEVAVSPVVTKHKTIIEHRIVQLDRKLGEMCSTNYTTTETDGVKKRCA